MRLLLAADLPLARLAPRAGFFTPANAHKSFLRAHGPAPEGQYRLSQQDA